MEQSDFIFYGISYLIMGGFGVWVSTRPIPPPRPNNLHLMIDKVMLIFSSIYVILGFIETYRGIFGLPPFLALFL